MKYSTVIFDLDGTLLDTSEGIMLGANYTARKMGAPLLTIKQQESFIGPPLIESFIRECGFTEVEARKAVELYRNRYKEKGLYEAKQYNKIRDLLISLKEKNSKTAVATLKRDDFAKKIMEHFDLSQFFDSIKGIDHNDTHRKSDIISSCLKEVKQSDLSQVVMIGDSKYDAIGANEAGIDFIAVTYGYGFKNKQEASHYKHVFIANDINELVEYFN